MKIASSGEKNIPANLNTAFVGAAPKRTLEFYHDVTHASEFSIRKMSEVTENMTIHDPQSHLGSCEACILGKHHVSPMKTSDLDRPHSDPGELAVTDICGPFRTVSLGGYTYFLATTDHTTRRTVCSPMAKKSDAREKLQEYKAEIERRTGKKLKSIRMDNMSETAGSDDFRNWL